MSEVSLPSEADTIDTNSSSVDDPVPSEDDTPVLIAAILYYLLII